MARFDRYMLSQLLVLFGFFSLILVLIYWINRAVRLFDRLIADGQSAWVFLELTSLSLPGIIRIVLPLSAFVAAAIAISYQLYIGEVTDAIEVGVGLLFVRELSARAYHGIRHKGVKQYKSFVGMLVALIATGYIVEALCEEYATRV